MREERARGSHGRFLFFVDALSALVRERKREKFRGEERV